METIRLVDLETAKKLVELQYDGDRQFYYVKEESHGACKGIAYAAPNLNDVLLWLNDKHKILISVNYSSKHITENEHDAYYFKVYNTGDRPNFYEWSWGSSKTYTSYNDALEYAIKKVIDDIFLDIIVKKISNTPKAE